MRRFGVVIGLGLGLGLGLGGAEGKPAGIDRTKAPEGGPAPKISLPAPTRLTLASGAKVLVVERHTLPMAVVSVVWPVGAANADVSGLAGLVGLTSDLLDEGTEKRGALVLAEELQSLGARLDTGSGWDSTGVTLTTTTRQLEPALAILADVLSAPAFDAKELERLRAERLTALVQMRDSASQVASNVFASQLYGSARYGQPLLGTEAGLKGIKREDVLDVYERSLRPSSATIIVVGDVNPKAIGPQLEKALAAWKDRAPSHAPDMPLPPVPPVARRALVDRPGAAQTEVRIGLPGVPRNHPDFFGITVMNSILGGNFSSRLNTNLREKHGYTYGASSGMAFRRDGGPFQVASPVKTAVTAPALTEAFVELKAIRAGEVSAEELRRAKDQLERAMARRFETLEQVAGELSTQVVYRLPDDYFATFAAKIEAVTAAEVLRVAKERIDPNKMAIVLVGDKAEIGGAVDKLSLGVFAPLDVEGKPVVVKSAAPVKPAPVPAKPAPGGTPPKK